MAQRAEGNDWTLLTGLALDLGDAETIVAAGAMALRTWHPHGPTRRLVQAGNAAYVPMNASQVPRALALHPPDVCIVRVSPPSFGQCSLGPAVSYTRSGAMNSTVLIGEVDEAMPDTGPGSRLAVDRFAALIESDTHMPAYPARPVGGVARQICEAILPLLPDRPVLQVGIGPIYDAMLSTLHEHRVDDLAFVGMVGDGVQAIAEEGQLRTADHDEPVISSDILGSPGLMRWVDANPLVAGVPSECGQAPEKACQRPRLVSIVSALQVSLTGQVNVEKIGGQPCSGLGGANDFLTAAAASAGGLRVLALPATSRDGARSRIVSDRDLETASISRTQIDVVVTEFGSVRLTGLSLRERAELLIAVSAPRFRSDLTDQARVEGVIPR